MMTEVHIMEYSFRRAHNRDNKVVASIFNYFVENSFAAYSDTPVSTDFFNEQLESAYPFYVIETRDGEVIGFGSIRPYSHHETLKRAATAMYFILPNYTGKGLGRRLLDVLTVEAKKMGVETLLVHISSKNKASLEFHKKSGFQKCGRFRRIGRKFGQDFDIVWMQKFIGN